MPAAPEQLSKGLRATRTKSLPASTWRTPAERPELLRLLKDARKGGVLLVESIDRLSRLPVDDWQRLKGAIDSKGLRIVALDLPTSHQGMQDTKGDEFTGRMLGAINSISSPEIGLHLFQSQNARCTASGVLYFSDKCGRSPL